MTSIPTQTAWGMWTIAALAFSVVLGQSAQAEEVTVPVPLAKGQVYEIEMTARQEKPVTASMPALTFRAEWRVTGADDKGFVIEEKILSADVPTKEGDDSLQHRVNAKVAQTMASVMTNTVSRMRTDIHGAPQQVTNLDEVRAKLGGLKNSILDTMVTELKKAGDMPEAQLAQLRAGLDRVFTQSFLGPDEALSNKIMETYSRFSLPMGMTLDTAKPTAYGDPAAGKYAEDGTAGTVRVAAYDPAAHRLMVEWQQHYSPALLQGQFKAIAAAMAQAIPDKARFQAEMAKLKIDRVDTVTYDIDPSSGLTRAMTIREAVSANGTEAKVTAKEIKIIRR